LRLSLRKKGKSCIRNVTPPGGKGGNEKREGKTGRRTHHLVGGKVKRFTTVALREGGKNFYQRQKIEKRRGGGKGPSEYIGL